QPAPVLVSMQGQVTRPVQRWDAALADSAAAMNSYRDECAPRRAATNAQLVEAAGGECVADVALVIETALRGLWRVHCRIGALRVGITLGPTTPARVQQLTVTPMNVNDQVRLAPACRP